MKTSVKLFALSLVLFFSACSSETDVETKDVPDIVITNFNSRYPGADHIKWKSEKSGGKKIYEAEFIMNGAQAEVEFDEAGNLVSDEAD